MANDLERERRAIGDRITAERRSYDSQSSRRAIGDRITAERRGTSESQVQDINALVQRTTERKRLKTIQPVGGLEAQRGRGVYEAPATGGVLASPLTEKLRGTEGATVPDRDYWPAMVMMSVDGLRAWEVRPIKTWRFTDALGNDVVMDIAQPAEGGA